MYVKRENSNILNEWLDSEINLERLRGGKYGVTLYSGEAEQGYDGQWYVKGYAPEIPEPTVEEKVAALEARYNLSRPVRTALLLAREAGQSVDVELMSRVDEIETLATPLRASGVTEMPKQKPQNAQVGEVV